MNAFQFGNTCPVVHVNKWQGHDTTLHAASHRIQSDSSLQAMLASAQSCKKIGDIDVVSTWKRNKCGFLILSLSCSYIILLEFWQSSPFLLKAGSPKSSRKVAERIWSWSADIMRGRQNRWIEVCVCQWVNHLCHLSHNQMRRKTGCLYPVHLLKQNLRYLYATLRHFKYVPGVQRPQGAAQWTYGDEGVTAAFAPSWIRL